MDRIASALCARLDLSPSAFERAARVAAGERIADPRALVTDFYRAASALVARIDRLERRQGEREP